jgi:NhaP-type Na+/H+ or K+/H+ antiporter
MNEWALPTIALLLIGYGAVSARLLGVGLPLTIVAGTLAGLVLFPQLNLWTAAALATILAPTDAALGLPVVSNRRLPSRIRQGLNVESGLNDGVCVPLLIIFITVAEAEEGVGHLEPLRVVLEEIGFGAVGGVAAGVLGAWVLRSFRPRGWMEGTWQQINAVATPLLAYTVAAALGGSGFIAAFVAGITYGAAAGEHAEEPTLLAEQSGELLNAVTFLLFGAILLEETQLPERPLMLAVVTWTVTLSVYAHGLSARLGANRYADWYAANARDHLAMSESAPVAEQRIRDRSHRPAPRHEPGMDPTRSQSGSEPVLTLRTGAAGVGVPVGPHLGGPRRRASGRCFARGSWWCSPR